MNTASGAGSPASASGAAAGDHAAGAARRARRRSPTIRSARAGVALDGDGPAVAVRAQPLDRRSSPQPAPTSHSSSPGARGEVGEGDGPDLALGELAVVVVRVVGQARAPAADRRVRSPTQSTATTLSGSPGACAHRGGAVERRSAGPPSCSSTRQRELAEAGVGQQRGDRGRGRARPALSTSSRAPGRAGAGAARRAGGRPALTTSTASSGPAQPGAGQRHRRRVRQDVAARSGAEQLGPGSRRCRRTSGRRWPARTIRRSAVLGEQPGQGGQQRRRPGERGSAWCARRAAGRAGAARRARPRRPAARCRAGSAQPGPAVGADADDGDPVHGPHPLPTRARPAHGRLWTRRSGARPGSEGLAGCRRSEPVDRAGPHAGARAGAGTPARDPPRSSTPSWGS